MRIAKPAQVAMINGLMRTPRHQLIASMGLGKSGALLMHAGGLEFHLGGWPGLCIVAPLQVALAWRREIPLWRPDLRVSLVAGDKKAREQALRTSADVYLLTYDNLPWMHEYVGGSWAKFGEVMVCDESTRIKKTRASFQTSSKGKRFLRTDGGVQTNSLAMHAGDFPFWVNATGTPTPNGLTDLWGQYWYVDGGYRLGNSYTSFEQRWFRVPNQHSDFAKVEPLPGAAEQISALVADVTTVVRVEDYIDVAKPNVVDRYVELPEKARRVYREMKARMRAEVEGKQVTALTAAAKTAKLLQIASGFAYWRDEDLDPELNQCEELHAVKLDAVESILEETNEPLVVVYYFKATLEQMKRRFKGRLRELDAKGQAQDDWNAGKVEILALQYSKGSMGLSLQHGGRNICLLTPTYKADDYVQVLERLGPLRQMQSGYKRAVNVFRILASATVDRKVFDVVQDKQDVERAMVELLMGDD